MGEADRMIAVYVALIVLHLFSLETIFKVER